jgi:hypothetical protein
MMKERMPWWHDEWTVKMTISFVETSRLFYFFSLIKPQIFATICFPQLCTQDRFRSYADLKLLWGPNSRATHWLSGATRTLDTMLPWYQC